MILSRMRSCLVLANVVRSRLKTCSRSSHHWHYRKGGPPPPKMITYCASFVQGVMWWWILWHVYTEPRHITGQWEFPVASKWSDEELGIPPEEDLGPAHNEAELIGTENVAEVEVEDASEDMTEAEKSEEKTSK